MTLEQLDLFPNEESLPPGGLARTSLWRAVVRAWMAHVQDCGGKSSEFWERHAPVGSLERTSLASCHLSAPLSATGDAWQSTGAHLVPSWGRWQNSVMGSPHGFSTLNTSEFPSSGAACSLSDILESPGPHLRKYFLSQRAAAGILRRAAKRGRALPPALHAALELLADPGGGVVPTVSSKWHKGTGDPSGDECQNLVLDTHTHTHTVSTLQGGGKRGYRIDAESAAGGHLVVGRWPH